MDSLCPNLFVKDIRASVAFYEKLGFTIVATNPATGEYVWAMLSNGHVTIMLQTFASLGDEMPAISRTGGGSLLLYIGIRGIRAFFENLQPPVTILQNLQVTFYGATEFSIADPDGFVLTFAEHEQTETAVTQ